MNIQNMLARFVMVSVLAVAASGCYAASPDESAADEQGPQVETMGLTTRTPTKEVSCTECHTAEFQCEVGCYGNWQCVAGCRAAEDACYESCNPGGDGAWFQHPCAGLIDPDKEICSLLLEMQQR